MTDPIPPALTPEEWAYLADGGVEGQVTAVMKARWPWHPEDGGLDCTVSPRALGAVCLYGQPFGFTQEDVAAIRYAANLVDSDWGHGEPADDDRQAPKLLALADRIAALLPPEP